MGAQLVEDPNPARGVAKRDQLLAEQLEAQGRAVGLGQLPGKERRHPVAAHHLAHRRAGAGPREELVLFLCQHVVAS